MMLQVATSRGVEGGVPAAARTQGRRGIFVASILHGVGSSLRGNARPDPGTQASLGPCLWRKLT